MAKATSNIKRVKVQGDVTLTLTPEEAVYLKALLATTVEYNDDNEYIYGNYKTAEAYSVEIWDALDLAEVPCATDIFGEDELPVNSGSLSIIAKVVDTF